jgi:hypothetical protein
MSDTPVIDICRYGLKPGTEAEMLRLLSRHWPTLHRLGLVTDEEPRIYRGVPAATEKEQHGAGANVIVEIFAWKSADSLDVAHRSPEVMAIWEPMGALCESMEFPHFEKVEIPLVRT